MAAAFIADPPTGPCVDDPVHGGCRLVLVGDVHDAWGPRDVAALRHLSPSMVLFVGDFGNEAVKIVADVAALDMPKAVILGNHDAWYTMTPKPRKRPLSLTLSAIELLQKEAGSADHSTEMLQNLNRPAAAEGGLNQRMDENKTDAQASSASAPSSSTIRPTNSYYRAVEAQLQLLGSSHVGFSSLPVPLFPISVVGARPFAKGGNPDSLAGFYDYLYGISSERDFTDRIVREALSAAGTDSPSTMPGLLEHSINALQKSSSSRALVLLAHNGPFGLGARAHDICGVDWQPGHEGDHGDKDLQGAIRRLHQAGVRLPLVCFGHMHHVLFGRKHLRQMVHVDAEHDTVYLNTATVPRVRRRVSLDGSSSSGGGSSSSGGSRSRRKSKPKNLAPRQQQGSGVGDSACGLPPTQHHFMVVEFGAAAAQVEGARDVWVDVEESRGGGPSSGSGQDASFVCKVVEERQVFRRDKAMSTLTHWDAHAQRYVTTTVTQAAAKETPPDLDLDIDQRVAAGTCGSS